MPNLLSVPPTVQEAFIYQGIRMLTVEILTHAIDSLSRDSRFDGVEVSDIEKAFDTLLEMDLSFVEYRDLFGMRYSFSLFRAVEQYKSLKKRHVSGQKLGG